MAKWDGGTPLNSTATTLALVDDPLVEAKAKAETESEADEAEAESKAVV